MSDFMFAIGAIVLMVVLATTIQDLLNNEFIPIRRDFQEWDNHVEEALYLANENRRKDEV